METYKKHVGLPFGKDNKYFELLFDALLDVRDSYVRYSIGDGEKIDHLERVFAYELYRQWGNRIDHFFEYKLILNAELEKVIDENISVEQEAKSDLNTITIERVTKYPDMVLHSSQENDKNQVMICEIKRGEKLQNSYILADMYKLCCYMDEKKFCTNKNPFRYGVFIWINGDVSNLSNILSERKFHINKRMEKEISCFEKEGLCKHFSNIVCIDYDGKELRYGTAEELLSSDSISCRQNRNNSAKKRIKK